MRIVIMGPPGVGKGTQSKLIVDHFKMPHISTGTIFRDLVKSGSTIGNIANSYMSEGKLVPNDITDEIVRKRLSFDDVKAGFLIDGYPRNIEQAKSFDKLLEEKGYKIDAFIKIEAPTELVVSRITGRRVCSKCGEIFHIISNRPKKEGICDKDGGSLIQRDDDSEKTVQNRIEIYEKQTAQIVDYYDKTYKIIYVDGTKLIKDIQLKIMKALGDKN